MGKRTNSNGFRLAYQQAWPRTLPLAPEAIAKRSAELALTPARNQLNFMLVEPKGRVFVVHAFLGGTQGVQASAALRRFVERQVGVPIVLNIHHTGKWSRRWGWVSKQDRRRALRSYGRFKLNRFFFNTAALLHLGFSLLSSELLLYVLVRLFKKHKRHWLVFKFLTAALLAYDVSLRAKLGLRVLLSGKLNGRPRKRKERFGFGQVPLQSVGSDVSYSTGAVATKFGATGIKVWLSKSSQGAQPKRKKRKTPTFNPLKR